MSDRFLGIYRNESIRLQNWDYGWNGYYFITICTKDKERYFGKIRNGKMVLSETGRLAKKFWHEIPDRFPYVKLDAFVVMPDHLHGIIIIDKSYRNDNDRNDGAGNGGTDNDNNRTDDHGIDNYVDDDTGIDNTNNDNTGRDDNGRDDDGRDDDGRRDAINRVPTDTNDRVTTNTNDRIATDTNNRAPTDTNNRVTTDTNDRVATNTDNGIMPGTNDHIPTHADTPATNTPRGGITGENNPMLAQNISRIIRWYKGRVTYESRKTDKGFAWQSRFYDRIIRDKRSLYKIRNYIRYNPLHWKGDDPFDVSWL